MRAKRLPSFRSVCFFGRGRDFDFRFCPRFCFSVHSVISVRQAKFPRIMRSFRFRRTFRFIRTARTGADSFGQNDAGNELPQNCRRFDLVFPFPFPLPFPFLSRAPAKGADRRPRLTRSNALHFAPCGRATIPPGKKIALRGFSRLWRVCAKIAQTQSHGIFGADKVCGACISPAYEKSPK